jgi:hypothetical protein
MKKSRMHNTRLVQVFLSQAQTPGPGIFEVSVDEDGILSCTCALYVSRGLCKHTKFVTARIDDNNGNYPLEILRKATEEEAELAKASNEAYRSFIIKYGKIEVF